MASYSKRTFRDKKYYWPDGDEIGWSAISGHWFQVERALNLFSQRQTCIQAGGNNGLYPVLLSRLFQTVLTFEPGPIMFDCLELNRKLHDCSNMISRQAALSDTRDRLVLQIHDTSNLGASQMIGKDSKQHAETVVDDIEAVLIDDLELDDCSFILLDIEGYEQYALQGAERTIDRFQPAIMLELNTASSAFGIDNAQTVGWLEARGYKKALEFSTDSLFLHNSQILKLV